MDITDFKDQLNKISDNIDEIKESMGKRDADIQLLTFRLAQTETEQLMLKKRLDEIEKKPAKKISEKLDKIFDWAVKALLTFACGAILFYLQNPKI